MRARREHRLLVGSTFGAVARGRLGRPIGNPPAALYQSMMGRTGSDDEQILDAVARIGRSTSAEDVVQLLGSHWRARVVGGWYSLFHDEVAVGPALLQSLETSQGALTAPGLVAAAITMVPDAAPASARRYLREDLTHGWGSAGLVAAGLERLGAASVGTEPTDEDRDDLLRLVGVASALRAKRTLVG